MLEPAFHTKIQHHEIKMQLEEQLLDYYILTFQSIYSKFLYA